MLKNYQIKWYVIVTGILTSVTTISLLLRLDKFSKIKWWEYPEHAFRISITLFVCWLIHGFFLNHKFTWLNNYAKHFVSITVAALVEFVLDYILSALLPLSNLNENMVPFDSLPNIIIHFLSAILVSIITYVVFYSVYTNTVLQNTKLENELLEQAHLRAQLISLQQQISPHFLFNSLSTLKTLTSEAPTKNYIVQLAAVYRYVLNFNQHYLTPLQDELTFIRSYLYIMTQRFEDSLQVSIDIPKEHLKFSIPSLSLQLLVENAVKHNTISPEQPLYIKITTNNAPALVVSNNLQLKKTAEESTGTGLKNIQERYKLLLHKPVEVVNNGTDFIVILPLLQK